jgi:hypothetical protein
LALTTVTGIVSGSLITDTTAAAIPAGTIVLGVDTTNLRVSISQPVGGVGVGSGDTIVIDGQLATLDTQRRVIITSGGTDTGITFTINGTNIFGTPISDTITGGTATLAAISNLDFKTVTSVTHTGSVAGTVQVGTTNGSTGLGTGLSPGPVASTQWFGINWHSMPVNVELSGIVSAGTTINWSWQYTYDDPNNLPSGVLFPQPWNHPTLNNQTVSLDGAINDPVAAVRFTVNSATLPATMRATWMEAGISASAA